MCVSNLKIPPSNYLFGAKCSNNSWPILGWGTRLHRLPVQRRCKLYDRFFVKKGKQPPSNNEDRFSSAIIEFFIESTIERKHRNITTAIGNSYYYQQKFCFDVLDFIHDQPYCFSYVSHDYVFFYRIDFHNISVIHQIMKELLHSYPCLV